MLLTFDTGRQTSVPPKLGRASTAPVIWPSTAESIGKDVAEEEEATLEC